MKHPAKNINETNILKSFFLGRHVIGIIVVILWISSGGCSQPSRPHSLEKADATETDGSIVARVNEEPISVVHFKRVMQHNRAMVHNYFAQKYNAQDNMDFWTTEYEGETPIKVLRQKTLEECVRIKIIQLLCKENGLIEDISYSKFLQDLKTENERRKNAVANHQVIYGPVQYRELQYFNYLLSNLQIALKRKLAMDEFYVDDEILKGYYESIKDRLYKREDDLKIHLISIPFRGRDEKTMLADKAKAYELIEKARAELEQGEPFEEVSERYTPDNLLRERFFGAHTSRIDSMDTNNVIKQRASAMSVGEISPPFQANRAFHIIKCVIRKHVGYRTFEDVKENVRNEYVDQKYNAVVDNLLKKAQVRINKDVFENL